MDTPTFINMTGLAVGIWERSDRQTLYYNNNFDVMLNIYLIGNLSDPLPIPIKLSLFQTFKFVLTTDLTQEWN